LVHGHGGDHDLLDQCDYHHQRGRVGLDRPRLGHIVMTYAEMSALAQNTTLRQRVAIAIEKRAQYTLLAGSTKPNVLLNAQQALRHPDRYVVWFINTVV